MITEVYCVILTVGQISLLCKGAETAVFERVRSGDVELIESHINEFAKVSVFPVLMFCGFAKVSVFLVLMYCGFAKVSVLMYCGLPRYQHFQC